MGEKIELDEKTRQTVQMMIKQRDEQISQINQQVNASLTLICNTFLNAKGIEGAHALSGDGTSLIPQLED